MAGAKVARRVLDPGWISLEVEGDIDMATVDIIEEAIAAVLDQESSGLVIDLTKTSFMDSTGLRTIVRTDRAFAEAQRDFALIVGPGPVSRLIDLSGLGTALRILDNLDGLVLATD